MSFDLEKIARLARLELSPSEKEKLHSSLTNVIKLFEELNKIDTTHISALAHSQEATQRLRPDAIKEVDQRGAILRNAPAAEADLFLVPQVIE
jgi:aspartyl-tRNA(Asn)/glutamyl-tRNA(Gln) amidotransferase subunit C